MKGLMARSKLVCSTLRATLAFSVFWVKLRITRARTYVEDEAPTISVGKCLRSGSDGFQVNRV